MIIIEPGTPDPHPDGLPRRRFDAWIQSGRSRACVHVGQLTLDQRRRSSGQAYWRVAWVYVDPDWRRQRVATELYVMAAIWLGPIESGTQCDVSRELWASFVRHGWTQQTLLPGIRATHRRGTMTPRCAVESALRERPGSGWDDTRRLAASLSGLPEARIGRAMQRMLVRDQFLVPAWPPCASARGRCHDRLWLRPEAP